MSNNYSIDTKTIKEWHSEIRVLSHTYREKYERCFLGQRTSVKMMHFYRNTSEMYMGLNETLHHLINYGASIDEGKCLSCKHEPVHRVKLAKNFERWYPWIIRCSDGGRFKKEPRLIYESTTTQSWRKERISPSQLLEL